ncbi:MAG: RNA polymerase sigma factor [Bacteroidia bacterium]
MTINETDIIKGCIEGDRKCQKQLYQHFAGKMLAVCMRYAKDRAEAEDMLQEGFLKVFQSISKYKGEGSFEGWIRKIMVYNAINLYKHRIRTFKEDLDVIEYDAPYSDDIIDKISVKEILALIQNLPEGYRLVFNLYAIEGYTHKEIGEQLGIAIGTSKSQYSRAKQLMQKMLAKHYQILNQPFEEAK